MENPQLETHALAVSAEMTRTLVLIAAIGAFVYGAVIPLGRLYYMYNIEPHPWSDLCGWAPGEAEIKPCKITNGD
jgi:hypothetical protein